MKALRFASLLAAGVCIASLGVFLLGSSSLSRYKEMEAYREILNKNLEDLKGINGDLLEELETLRTDPEAIVLEARKLGYYREDEKPVRVDDFRPSPRYTPVGRIIRQPPEPPDRNWIFKAGALLFPFLVLVVRRLFLPHP